MTVTKTAEYPKHHVWFSSPVVGHPVTAVSAGTMVAEKWVGKIESGKTVSYHESLSGPDTAYSKSRVIKGIWRQIEIGQVTEEADVTRFTYKVLSEKPYEIDQSAKAVRKPTPDELVKTWVRMKVRENSYYVQRATRESSEFSEAAKAFRDGTMTFDAILPIAKKHLPIPDFTLEPQSVSKRKHFIPEPLPRTRTTVPADNRSSNRQDQDRPAPARRPALPAAEADTDPL